MHRQSWMAGECKALESGLRRKDGERGRDRTRDIETGPLNRRRSGAQQPFLLLMLITNNLLVGTPSQAIVSSRGRVPRVNRSIAEIE